MRPYNVEIFTQDFEMVGNTNVNEITYKEDYLSSDGNTVTVLALPGVKKQDYIRISRGNEEYAGIVTEIGYGTDKSKKLQTISYKPLMELLNTDVLFDVDAIAAAPEAALEGYTFVGWRQDGSAEKKVLSEYIITSEEPVTLYAVFKKQMTIGLMPNGGTLTVSGAAESFMAYCYYNNGNSQSEPTTVPASPYTRKNMSFCGWSIDSLSTPSYKPGEKGVFPAGATLYAMWVTTEYDFVYTGSYVQFTIPQDGIYEFEVWGASGAAAKVDSLVAEGGLGGHSKGYRKMKKDEVVYVFNGGSPNGTSSGANGGGGGYNYGNSKQYGAGGGGSTHVATRSGVLGYNSSSGLNYASRECVLIVAGGGGGGGIENGAVHKGGDGGGERGGNGSGGALGGRQISTGSSPSTNFGSAPYYSGSNTAESGGGGGWFAGNYGLRGESGAGGSGYVDGVAPFTHNGKYYPAETEAGVNEGHGKAFIRYVECA